MIKRLMNKNKSISSIVDGQHFALMYDTSSDTALATHY